jgi:hypothetical protein
MTDPDDYRQFYIEDPELTTHDGGALTDEETSVPTPEPKCECLAPFLCGNPPGWVMLADGRTLYIAAQPSVPAPTAPDAWDEGYRKGAGDQREDPANFTAPRNPYRRAEPEGGCFHPGEGCPSACGYDCWLAAQPSVPAPTAVEVRLAEAEAAIDRIRRRHPRGDEEDGLLAPGLWCPTCGRERTDNGYGACPDRAALAQDREAGR